MVNLESLVKMKAIPGVIVRDANTGKPGLAPIRADAVVNEAGETIQVEMAAAIASAVALLKDAGDGSTLPADRDSLKKLADALAASHTLIDEFLNGGADGGTMDKLVELVTQISANKDNITALLSGKIDAASIVNDLVSGGVDKVLSAEQGRQLKILIDALHNHVNQADVLDKLTSAGGKLLFDGKDVGDTRTWVGTTTSVPTDWPTTMHPDGVLFLIPAA